jgi:hypothetical protein
VRDGNRIILVPAGGRPKDPAERPGEGAVTSYRFPVGVVCWIDAQHLPFIAPQDVAWAKVGWPNRVCIGLVATTNPPPPDAIFNVPVFRNTRQFRAMMWGDLQVEVDRATDRVTRCRLTGEVLDPGWTPPFDKKKVALGDLMEAAEPAIRDRQFYPGELSPVSKMYAQQRHPNSPLVLPADEQVVAEGLIKFRAGKHTDEVGIGKTESPFHVPWTWSALAITYAGKGEFRAYTRGAIFPTHRWYVGGVQVRTSLQAEVEMSDKEPALTTGAPADRPQADDDSRPGTSVTTHKYTLSAGKQLTIPLGLLPRAGNGRAP